ncbi:MAG: outer membrane lipoprotein carrier protein LolA [Bacteroidales bacterium]|jgi:outer membrane lipoprotein-sorting protein|nr:outer membrane lipoprotein carrier protein LolA [Bacteroidales bacterium]
MKKTLLITILVTLTISGFAQNSNQRREQRKNQKEVKKTERGIDDPKAHDILSAVRKQLKSYNSLKIDFTYLLENKTEKIKESKKGTILIKGNKYNLNFMGLNVISDGKNIWNFNREAKEVQITEVNPKETDMMNPIALIDNYEKNFRAKLIREDTDKGVPVMIIDLLPFENRNFHKVRIATDKAKKTIVFSEIHDKNGTIITFRVDRMQTNVSAPDSEFKFDVSKHPGVEVIDMR